MDLNELLIVMPHYPREICVAAKANLEETIRAVAADMEHCTCPLIWGQKQDRMADIFSYELMRTPENPLPQEAAPGTRRLVGMK